MCDGRDEMKSLHAVELRLIVLESGLATAEVKGMDEISESYTGLRPELTVSDGETIDDIGRKVVSCGSQCGSGFGAETVAKVG